MVVGDYLFFFFSSRRRHTILVSDWSSDVCSSDLGTPHEAADPRIYDKWRRGIARTGAGSGQAVAVSPQVHSNSPIFRRMAGNVLTHMSSDSGGHMKRTLWMFAMVACATSDSWAVDAKNGDAVLTREQCNECHTVNGQGMGHEPPTGTSAVDLADRVTSAYRPAALASALWNHTPDMWTQMLARGDAPPSVTEAEWRDLFAYLYTLRFAEKPAQVGHGEKAFETNGCAGCHSLAPPAHGPGKPVSEWAPVNDPVSLVWQMWNHA